jgi:hypothetical protein
MYVPILSDDDVIAHDLRKQRPSTRFTQNHLQIAGYQSSGIMAIQRMNLLERVRKEEQIRHLFTLCLPIRGQITAEKLS